MVFFKFSSKSSNSLGLKTVSWYTKKVTVSLTQLKLSQTYFISALFLATFAIRFFVFKNYYVFANDDIYYFDWVHKIANSGGFRNSDSIIMPPGYPIIMLVENFFLSTPFAIKFFEQVVVFSFFPLFLLYILKLINVKFDNFIIFLCFTIPVTLIGTSTINIASEIWYSLIISTATILLLKFESIKSFHLLFLSTLMFSLSYLIRPESIIYSLLAVFIMVKTIKENWHLKSSEKMQYMSLLLVVAIPILSLSYFLTKYFGSFTLSGKLKPNLDYSSGIANNAVEKLILNSLGLFRVIAAPMFLGPATVILVSIGLIYFIRNIRKNFIEYYILILPALLTFSLLIVLYPMGRPLIPIIPTFVFLAALGWNFIKCRVNNFFLRVLKVGLAILLIMQVILPFATSRLSDSTVGYYRALDTLKAAKDSLVFAREPTLFLVNSNFLYCSVPEECSRDPEILLLSTSSRAKLTPGIEIELKANKYSDLRFRDSVYRFSSVTDGTYYPVFVYKKIE